MPRTSQMAGQIYDYLQKVIAEQGYAPSVREICQAVGLKSPSTVHLHLKRLQEKGLIEKGNRKGRAIVLVNQREKNRVPLLGQVAAGPPILAEQCVEGYVAFDCQGCEEEYFALRVRGESMRNAGILPHDIVVAHQQPTARHGEIVVALLGDEATVKRLGLKNGQIWLFPENEAYQPIDGTNAQILGKVAAVIRHYD